MYRSLCSKDGSVSSLKLHIVVSGARATVAIAVYSRTAAAGHAMHTVRGLYVAGGIAVRGILTWQHSNFWDALRFARIAVGVLARSAGASCGLCEYVQGAHLAACAAYMQTCVRTKPSAAPGRLGRLLCISY